MSNELIPNEKTILAGIKKDADGIKHHKKELLKYAFSLGEKLSNAKKLVPYGQWENWLESHSECDFGINQAAKYMLISSEKTLAMTFFSDITSINGLTKAISEATPEQQAKAEQIKIEEEFKREAEKQRKADEQTKKQATPKQPEIIEGEFTEVKPEPKKPEVIPEPIPEENPIDLLQETIAELQDANGELLKEIESVTRVLDANDQTGKALAEAKRYREENRVLKERINGLQSECNEAKRAAKYWKGKFEKLEKEFARDAA